jgi:hypothetical protein
MARCETCGVELQDASQRFCGGDRCYRVFMFHQTADMFDRSPRDRPHRDAIFLTNTVNGLTVAHGAVAHGAGVLPSLQVI